MRFSWLTRQSTLALLLLLSLDIILILISRASVSLKNIPLILFLTLIILILATYTIKYLYQRLGPGMDGEEAVYQELKKLPPDYVTLNDFNYNNKDSADFVVIGPTGIFTIEAKNYHKKVITRTENDILGDSKPFHKNIIQQAQEEMKNLHEYLLTTTYPNLLVHPVLVFTNPRTKIRFGLNLVGGVTVVGRSWLRKAILERPQTLTQEQCSTIRDAVQKYTSIV